MVAGAAAGAGAFALYARVEWPWFALGWIGLVPWLAALDAVGTFPGALAAGVTMAVAFTLAVFHWFAPALADYAAAPPWVALAALALGAPLLEPQLVVFALARLAARRRGAGAWRTSLVGASAWVATEWAVPKLFGDTVGQGFYASRLLRQAADLGGAPVLTFVLVVANEWVLAALRAWRATGRRWRVLGPAACLTAVIAALAAYGAVRIRQLGRVAAGPPVTVGLVQADLVHYDRLAAEVGTYEAVRRILDVHFALSRAALARAEVDLLVWPETVYPTTFGAPKSADGAAFDAEIAAFVDRSGRPLVFGAYDAADGREYNAAVFLMPQAGGRLGRETYRKAALFPLTERVPAWLDGERMRRWFPWLGTWTAGSGPAVVALALPDGRRLRVAPVICYDAVDPRHTRAAVGRGAEVILTLSNDGWFADGAGARLHLVVSAFRSLETRRPQIRATSTGISAVVTPLGDLVATTDVHQRTALVAAVTPVGDATSLALAWGDWPGPVAFVAALVLLVPRRRTLAPDQPTSAHQPSPTRALAPRTRSMPTR